MPDDMDRVQELVEQQNATALEEQLRNMPTGESLKTCCVCYEDIPEARRKAMPGVMKCITCQEEWEMMHTRGSL